MQKTVTQRNVRMQVLDTIGLIAFVAAVTLTGCKKEKESAGSSQSVAQPVVEQANAAAQGTPQNTVPQATAAPKPAAPPPQAPTAFIPPVAGQELDLNRELRRWILANRRPPKNFEDFAGSAGLQIPAPPQGKKYVIDKSMHVVLVKR